MRKAIIFSFMVLAVMAFAASPIFACDGNSGTKSASKSGDAKVQQVNSNSKDCKVPCKTPCTKGVTTAAKSDEGVKAQMVGDKTHCTKGTATTTSAEVHPGCPYLAEHANSEEMKKLCAEYDGKCEMVNMSIKGMTCGGCENAVKTALEGVPGVIKVAKVSYKDGVALVCFDPEKGKTSAMTTAVTNRGYEAEIIPAVAHEEAGTMQKTAAGTACCSKSKATTKDGEGTH